MATNSELFARRRNEAKMTATIRFYDNGVEVASSKCRPTESDFKPDETEQGARRTNTSFMKIAVPVDTVVRGHWRCKIEYPDGGVQDDLFVHTLPVKTTNQSEFSFLVRVKRP